MTNIVRFLGVWKLNKRLWKTQLFCNNTKFLIVWTIDEQGVQQY